jgi:hypothetical protein
LAEGLFLIRIPLATGNGEAGHFELQLSWAEISDEEWADSMVRTTDTRLLRARFSICLFQIRFDP